MSEFMRQFCFRILFLKSNYMLEIKKNIGQKLQKSYVGKAGTIAKKEFGIFSNHAFQRKFGRTGASNSEELELTPEYDFYIFLFTCVPRVKPQKTQKS